MIGRRKKLPILMDPPAPRMTVAQFDEWQARNRLVVADWMDIPVVPGDRVEVTFKYDGSVHVILIVEDVDGEWTHKSEKEALNV